MLCTPRSQAWASSPCTCKLWAPLCQPLTAPSPPRRVPAGGFLLARPERRASPALLGRGRSAQAEVQTSPAGRSSPAAASPTRRQLRDCRRASAAASRHLLSGIRPLSNTMSNYSVSLVGPAPWGFRLQGGKDFNMPLTISRLSDGGKAARAQVGIGDVVLTIDGTSTEGMTHLEAQNKIKACTGNLNMNLQRVHSAPKPDPVPVQKVTTVTNNLDEVKNPPKRPPRKHIVDTYTEFYHTPTHSDASKKRLIEDTEDWHPRTGTTQSRSFRILAQITGTEHMKEPETETTKKTKESQTENGLFSMSADLLNGIEARDSSLDFNKHSVSTQTVEMTPASEPSSTPLPPMRPESTSVSSPLATSSDVIVPSPRLSGCVSTSPHGSDSLEASQPVAYATASVRTMPESTDKTDTKPAAATATAFKPAGPQSAVKYTGWQPSTQAAPASGRTSNNIAPSGAAASTDRSMIQPQLTEQDTLVQRAEYIPAGNRTPMCAHCNQVIRGPFLVALGKSWHPEEFNCAHCRASMAYIGFVEEKGSLYCEMCYEKFFAPECSRCQRKILGEVINALKQTWHVSCFVCVACNNPIRNNVFHLEDGDPYCETDYYTLFGTMCYGCEFPIEAGDRFLEALGHTWHDTCFVCSVCCDSLEGQTFFSKKDKPLCKKHAHSMNF
ncbi:PDZ and LIM domain protein 5 isoform X2 [Carettochelys insculpta]|uniref:PDZ and LIM domain protein 5 isoform X2 n=1 Tax=Carettochelys insculpta TaxID=44489 RepID=UPI003EC0266C